MSQEGNWPGLSATPGPEGAQTHLHQQLPVPLPPELARPRQGPGGSEAGALLEEADRPGLSATLDQSRLTLASPGWHPGEFLISPVEGVLRVRKDVELDRETIAFYNLTICARDRGVPPLSSTVSLGPPFYWLYLAAP